MNAIARPAALLLLFTFLISPALAQKRQMPARPQSKPATAPAPAPTFDNLVPADSYALYCEVRDAGQLIRSSAINDLLEPILKLAGPPKEFKSVVKWLKAHADQVMSTRLLVATWPVNKNVPDTLVVIEFASPEEAAKFTTPLNEFLPTVLPTPPVDPSAKNAPPPKPPFHLERLGSLVVISPRPWTMKQLRPAGSKPLADDPKFRTARNRFNSESLFAFVDFKLMDKEEEERRKQAEAERQKVEEQAKQQAKQNPEQAVTDEELIEARKAEKIGGQVAILSSELPKETPTPDPDPMSAALSNVGSAFFGGETHWPEAIAVALSFEGESFDLRGLMVSAPGETSDVLPFWPNVIPGMAIAPEAPNVFPANTELFATMSLDLPQIFAVMSKPRKAEFTVSKGRMSSLTRAENESPFKPIEKKLDISIENDLLPLLGSEVAIGLPMRGLSGFGLPGPPPAKPEKKEAEPDQSASTNAPVVAISVKDRERLRVLMPKLIEALGFKGASSFATTERREDTELISYANFFAYAFVGDFLVLSSDAATTRQVVDSYLKHETLASDTHYRAYTRWQSRQVQGQFYISPALMESYRAWATQPPTMISDQTRNLVASLSLVAQPISYSLSNEGLGPLHELHVPKNLVAILAASISGALNPPPLVQNERMAIGLIYQILYAEEQYKGKQGAGSYGTVEDLIAADLLSKDGLEKSGYKFEVIVNGDQFEVSAVPSEYGKTGSLSLFLDHERVLRGGDRNGAAATAADPRFPN